MPPRWHVGFVVVLAGTAAACAPTARPPTALPPLPPPSASAPDPEDTNDAPPPRDPNQERDDAVLLGTLILGGPRISWTVANLGSGIATIGASGTFTAFATVYLARGGPALPATGPLLFGLGGTALGVYQLASGGDFAQLQAGYGIAALRGATPRALIDEFEPRLREASYRFRSRRHWFAATNLALAGLSVAAGAFLVASRPQELESNAYPSVLFGLGAINAIAGLSTLIQPTPVESAWESYVKLTTR